LRIRISGRWKEIAMDEADSFHLVLPFDSDDPAFARGVEVGMLHASLHDGQSPVCAMVHAENAEMMLRLAEAHGRSVRADDLGGDWLAVEFS